MKTTYKILTLGLVAGAMASCADDLNTDYLGYYVTTEKKEEVQAMDPEMASAAAVGAFANFNLYMNVSSDHFDFGYPSIMLGLDLQTEDCAGKLSGYNWHWDWEGFSSPNLDGDPTAMAWYTLYKQVFTANALISTMNPETEIAEQQFYLGNGYALRAFDYFQLVQLYQFNYEGHENALGVPLITEKNSVEAAANGIARNTVQETYDLILSDINTGIELIEKSGLSPNKLLSSKPNRLISLATAYGIRARINLVMHKYAEAAADADKAIQNFTGRPYTKQEVSVPTFASLEDPAWMWGIAIAETDRCVTSGIVNWPSFMCSFSKGYVTNGAWKYCGYGLYSQIPSSDVRKGWFLDDNYYSDHLTDDQLAYFANFVGTPNYNGQDNTSILFPQTNVKFNSYKGVLPQTTNANDIPLMRIEEMYLTKAEGLALSGNLADAKTVLEGWVKTYRNSAFKSTAQTVDEFQEECVLQRRIELWGEGIAWFDVMRLNKGIDRRGCRFPYDWTYNIPAGDPVLIYCVPRSEITANAKISEDEANEISTRPVPVQ